MKERLFIHGGDKARNKDFDYLAPIGDAEFKAATEVLKKKQLSGFYKDFLGGDRVREFEDRFAEYIGTKYAIAVNSGTSALHIAIAACDIGPGDEVIVPPFTFTATASAVLMNNAIPIFADIDPDTFCIDPRRIRDAITDKTKAIIPVHIYGKSADMDRIMAVAKERGLVVIEDACQAPGSRYKGRKVGSIGDVSAFSFVETKNMVIGEGGMVTTNDDRIAERCRMVRNHGEVWTKGKPREYLSNMLGYNFRMTEIVAAIGIEQLKRLDLLNDSRKKNAAFLQDNLGALKGIKVLQFNEDEVCHLFAVLFDEEEASISKEKFIELMDSEGIPLSRGYPHPLYKNPVFQEKIAYGDKGCPYSYPFYGRDADYADVACEVAEDVCRKLICIRQIHYPYGIDDMKDIVKAFKKIFNNIGEL